MIGRIQEQKELRKALESNESEFIMIYGRRRVGKTFLVREFFKDDFVFSCTGIANGTRQEELLNFRSEILRRDETIGAQVPGSWMEAFESLRLLAEKSKSKRKVIFLDEVPWMYTQKSDFLKALEHFWNSWAATRCDVVLIVCGSAASWMVKKMVKNRGGLHNRVTLPLKLRPFTLGDTRDFLFSKGIRWDEKTIAECYMIMGGIPYYLRLLDKGLSLAQNVDRLFFSETALLKSEFDNLYASLFKDSKDYVRIVEVLSRKKSGYTRDEIIKAGKFRNGGGLSEKLEDLEECGFIRRYATRGDVSSLYQLTDFYTLFYYQFIKKGSGGDENFWMHIQGKPPYNTWKGLSFERLCFAHLPNIKGALGISGIGVKAFSYHAAGLQVDMILERDDRVVDIIEIKYHEGAFTVSSEYSEILGQRRAAVAGLYKKRMSFMTVIITSDGLKANEYSAATIHQDITIADLM